MGAGQAGGKWTVKDEEMTILIGIIDVLQFWTPKKRLARRFKKAMHMERDEDGSYRGDMLDTVKPAVYKERFTNYARELFTSGSWLESLPRMYGGWENVVSVMISQLPEAQQNEATSRICDAKDQPKT